MKNIVSLDLMSFIEGSILPRYVAFDGAHGMEHVMGVIRRSLEIAERLGADIDMVYVVAAYHDLGLEGPRAVHHLTGGKILASDVRLRRWFSAEQLRIMREAVEDHRASSSRAPRSIYGKIVAEADRDLEPMSVMRRTVQYGLSHYPEKTREEHWRRFEHHLSEKYSPSGYIRLWLPGTPNETKLKQLREYIADKALLQRLFDKIFEEESGHVNT